MLRNFDDDVGIPGGPGARRIQADPNMPPISIGFPGVQPPLALPSATEALKTSPEAVLAERAKKVEQVLRSIGAQIRIVAGAGGVLTRFGHAQVPGIDQHSEETLDEVILAVARALKQVGYSVEFVTEATDRKFMVVSWEHADKPQADKVEAAEPRRWMR